MPIRGPLSGMFFRRQGLLPWIAAGLTLIFIAWAHRLHLEGWPPRYKASGINEYWHVAAALCEGRGYSDPFGVESGPTAWVPPFLTWIYAAIFWVAPSQAAAFLAGGVIKSLGYAATAGVWTALVRRHMGFAAASGFVAGWLILLHLGQESHLTVDLHDPWLVGLALALTLSLTDGLPFSRRRRLGAAVIFAIGPLVGPAVLLAQLGTIVARFGVFMRRRYRAVWWRFGVRPMLPALIALTASSGLWVLRCHHALGKWVPIKSNGAYEAWQAQVSTRDGIPGYSIFYKHPFLNDGEAAAFQREGEIAYVERHGREFQEAVRTDPLGWLEKTANRAVNALVWLKSSTDLVTVEPREDVLKLLPRVERHGLVRLFGSTKWKWLDVTRPVEEWWRAVDAIPELSEAEKKLLLGSWLRAREAHRRAAWSPAGLARGALLAGVPAFAAIHILLRRSVARGPLPVWAIVYLLYLAPYILISHYSRYQMPLAGLQVALIVGLAFAYFARRRPARSAVAPSLS